MKINGYSLLLILGPLLLLLPGAAYAANLGDISNWLYNIAAEIPPLIKLVVAISYISGFGFLMGAMFKLKEHAQSTVMMAQQYPLTGPLIYLLVGAILIYFAGFVKVGSVSLFGQDSILAYQASATVSLYSSLITPITTILRFIGYLAFLRGFYILARLGGHHAQPGTLTKAMVHIFGGILAINIEATYNILLNTLLGNSGIA